MYFPNIKKATPQDFDDLNKIERVRVRPSVSKKGFGCSVSIYGPNGTYGKSEPFKIRDLEFMGNLYAKVTHYIQQALAADEISRSQDVDGDGLVVLVDDTPIEEYVKAYHMALLDDFGENTTGIPTRRALSRAKITSKWHNLGDYVVNFHDKEDATAGVVQWFDDWASTPKENGQPKKNSTRNRGLSETRSFLKWLKRAKRVPFLIKLDEDCDIEWRKCKIEFAPYYTIDEIRAMLAVDDKDTFRIAVHAYTGMRLQEVLNMRWSDIQRGQIWVRISKTDTPRFVKVMPELMDLFQQRKSEGHLYEGHDKQTGLFIGDDFMFTQLDRDKNYCSQRRDIERIQKKAGVSPIAPMELAGYEAQIERAEDPSTIIKPRARRFHAFRWTYASCMMRAGCDSSILILQMGHSHPQMTRHYAQISALMHEVDDEQWPNSVLAFANKPEVEIKKAVSINSLRIVSA